ncbi:MAG: ABC transporter substrate-binding protein [Pseudomonadota bacterium]
MLASCIASATHAQAPTPTPIHFRLDWVWQAPQSIWTLAAERGYFKDEGLEVAIDRGFGGPDTIGNVGAGSYEFGFSDINNLVEFNAKNPNQRVISVFVVYDATLSAIITRKGQRHRPAQDLEGRLIGAPTTTAGRTLFPAFAKVNDIDLAKIRWQTIGIQLQDQQFAAGAFDAIASFSTTSLLNLKLLGVERKDLTVFNFFDHGLDLYGSALLVRPDWAAAHPETVRKFLRATVKGNERHAADKAGAIASLQKRDPLLDTKVELERLDLMIELALRTPSVARNGVSHVDPARLDRGLAIVAEAFNIAPSPTAADLFDARYLPPAARPHAQVLTWRAQGLDRVVPNLVRHCEGDVPLFDGLDQACDSPLTERGDDRWPAANSPSKSCN